MENLNMYRIEITDTFGDQANYSWVRRYEYKATSERGAIQKLAREHGAGWRKQSDGVYKIPGQCVVCFVELV